VLHSEKLTSSLDGRTDGNAIISKVGREFLTHPVYTPRFLLLSRGKKTTKDEIYIGETWTVHAVHPTLTLLVHSA